MPECWAGMCESTADVIGTTVMPNPRPASASAAARTVNWLAGLYVAIRILHGLLYIADQASLRSASFLVGLIINIAIFVLPAFK